jgi:hypothetical protein
MKRGVILFRYRRHDGRRAEKGCTPVHALTPDATRRADSANEGSGNDLPELECLFGAPA